MELINKSCTKFSIYFYKKLITIYLNQCQQALVKYLTMSPLRKVFEAENGKNLISTALIIKIIPL